MDKCSLCYVQTHTPEHEFLERPTLSDSLIWLCGFEQVVCRRERLEVSVVGRNVEVKHRLTNCNYWILELKYSNSLKRAVQYVPPRSKLNESEFFLRVILSFVH